MHPFALTYFRSVSNKSFRVPLVAFLLLICAGELTTHVIYFVQLFNISSSTALTDFIATIKSLMAVTMIADTILSVTLVLLLRGEQLYPLPGPRL